MFIIQISYFLVFNVNLLYFDNFLATTDSILKAIFQIDNIFVNVNTIYNALVKYIFALY